LNVRTLPAFFTFGLDLQRQFWPDVSFLHCEQVAEEAAPQLLAQAPSKLCSADKLISLGLV